MVLWFGCGYLKAYVHTVGSLLLGTLVCLCKMPTVYVQAWSGTLPAGCLIRPRPSHLEVAGWVRASVVNLNSKESSRQGPVIGCRVSEHGGHGFLDDSLVEGALLLAPVPETADYHSHPPPCCVRLTPSTLPVFSPTPAANCHLPTSLPLPPPSGLT